MQVHVNTIHVNTKHDTVYPGSAPSDKAADVHRLKQDVLREVHDQVGSSLPHAAAAAAPASAMEVRPVLFRAPDGKVVHAYQLPNTQVCAYRQRLTIIISPRCIESRCPVCVCVDAQDPHGLLHTGDPTGDAGQRLAGPCHAAADRYDGSTDCADAHVCHGASHRCSHGRPAASQCGGWST